MNVVPTIHALDLGSIVLNLADSKPKTRYLLAVDDSHSTLSELVKAVSQGLGTGHTKIVPREEALLDKDLTVGALRYSLIRLESPPAVRV